MAARTWITTSVKNFSDDTAWVEGVAPVAGDDVTMTGTGTCTIDGTSGAPNACRSFVCTLFTGTLTHAADKYLNIGDGTVGHLTIVSGMTYAPASTSYIQFVSTTTGNNLTFGGKTMGKLTFDGVGGGWTFQDNLTTSSGNGAMLLTNGSLDFNGKTVIFGIGGFTSDNSNTRSLTLGAAAITVSNTTSVGTWNIATTTGMTFSGASSTITFSGTSGGATFNGGGLTYGTLTSTAATTATHTITGANTFATLTTSSGAGATANYRFGANQTVTGTHTANGNSVINRVFLRSQTRATQYSITAATFAYTNIDIQDIAGVDSGGADSRDLSAVTGGAGNGGNNSGWTFSTPKNAYLVTGASIADTASNFFTTSGGATPISPVLPMLHDTMIADANSITAGSLTITMSRQRKPGMNMTGVTNSPIFSFGTANSEYYGDIVFSSGHTISGTANSLLAANTGVAQSMTTAGNTITFRIGVDKGGSSAQHTLTLADATTASNSTTITSGVLTNSTTYSGTSIVNTGGTLRPGANINMSAAGTMNGTAAIDSPNYTITWTADAFTWGSSGLADVKGLLGLTSVSVTDGTLKVGTSGLAYTSTPTVTGTGTLTSTGVATFTPTTMSVAAAAGGVSYSRIHGGH